MARKTGLIIKKEILHLVAEKPRSYRELESKLGTNYLTIRKHCEELAYLGLIDVAHEKRNEYNGRPFTVVSTSVTFKRTKDLRKTLRKD